MAAFLEYAVDFVDVDPSYGYIIGWLVGMPADAANVPWDALFILHCWSINYLNGDDLTEELTLDGIH